MHHAYLLSTIVMYKAKWNKEYNKQKSKEMNKFVWPFTGKWLYSDTKSPGPYLNLPITKRYKLDTKLKPLYFISFFISWIDTLRYSAVQLFGNSVETGKIDTL